MNYWFNAFTGTTWDEFRKSGASVSGFRDRNWKRAEPIRPGDVFLCYMVGVKHWIGLLEVGPLQKLDDIYRHLSERFNSGHRDTAARHNEHQP